MTISVSMVSVMSLAAIGDGAISQDQREVLLPPPEAPASVELAFPLGLSPGDEQAARLVRAAPAVTAAAPVRKLRLEIPVPVFSLS
jgi:hypothetical protein